MLPANSRRSIERPPSRIAGAVYIVIGIFALFVAAFVLFYEGGFGPVTNFRMGFGIVIALYGAFRIYTGISMLRRAARASAIKNSVPLDGVKSESNTPIE
jgi:uncharacterized membrane protein